MSGAGMARITGDCPCQYTDHGASDWFQYGSSLLEIGRRFPCFRRFCARYSQTGPILPDKMAAMPAKGAHVVQIQISLLLDRARADTLTAQLVSQLRDAIRVGRIAPGVRLPSSRRLSEQLGIGRNTVVRAYETLEMECYVESRPASGIFAAVPPLDLRPAHRLAEAPTDAGGIPRTGTGPGRHRPPPAATERPLLVRFRPRAAGCRAVPAEDLAPAAANLPVARRRDWDWRSRATRSAWPSLRSAIANHLAAARGIVAEPGQIVIVSGAARPSRSRPACWSRPASLRLRRESLLPPRRRGVPGRRRRTSRGAGGSRRASSRDDLPRASGRAAVCDAGAPISHRPHAVASRAASRSSPGRGAPGATILEDDRGADFRYEGGAPPRARRLRAGAHHPSRHLLPVARGTACGWATWSCRRLVDAVRAAKILAQRRQPLAGTGGGGGVDPSGSYASHVMRMRTEYRERRDHLLDGAAAEFRRARRSAARPAGLHLFWQLPPGVPDAATVEALGAAARVGVYSLESGGVHHARTQRAVAARADARLCGADAEADRPRHRAPVGRGG